MLVILENANEAGWVGQCAQTSEAAIERWWFGGGVAEPLITSDGRPVLIRYPVGRGRQARRDCAAVEIDGQLLQGDVEFHVRASDWQRHHHERDPHYNDVVLQVVLVDDEPVYRQNGAIVPTVVIQPGMAPAPMPSQCLLLESIAPGDLLDSLGDERFTRRVVEWEAAVERDGADQALYAALLDAAGYAANRTPCRQLAARLPVTTVMAHLASAPADQRRLVAAALLLGAAGLLRPPALPPDPAADRAHSWHIWHRLGGPLVLDRSAWRLAGVRPANRPERRLAGIATLLASAGPATLTDWLAGTVGGIPPAAWPRTLVRLFTVPEASATHPEDTHGAVPDGSGAPGRVSSTREAALIGTGRAAILALNVALPYLATVDASGARLAYRAFPRLPENEVTRHGQHQLFGMLRPDIVASARRQQGIHELVDRYCGAGRCTPCRR